METITISCEYCLSCPEAEAMAEAVEKEIKKELPTFKFISKVKVSCAPECVQVFVESEMGKKAIYSSLVGNKKFNSKHVVPRIKAFLQQIPKL